MHWAATARAQDGVISRRQLALAGVGSTRIARLVQRGEIEPLSHGVFLAHAAPLTHRARLWAAVCATDGVLGFATAARLWGIDTPAEDHVHVIIAHDRRRRPPAWIRLHRVAVDPWALTVRNGLPITSQAWTVLDYVATRPRSQRSALMDRAVQRRWVTPAEVERRLREHPGRTGNVALRELALQLGDGAAAHSERVLHRLLRGAGISGWIPNYAFWRNGELIAVIDVAIPARRIAIEVDGLACHVDADRFQSDRRRQNDLVVGGWTVLRFTWADLTERPGYVVAAVRQAAA